MVEGTFGSRDGDVVGVRPFSSVHGRVCLLLSEGRSEKKNEKREKRKEKRRDIN
jgi:hypothetical protein